MLTILQTSEIVQVINAVDSPGKAAIACVAMLCLTAFAISIVNYFYKMWKE